MRYVHFSYEVCCLCETPTLRADYCDEMSTKLAWLVACYVPCTSQGKLMEAEAMYARALSISETHLGPEHPSVGTILNNLAEVLTKRVRTTCSEKSTAWMRLAVPSLTYSCLPLANRRPQGSERDISSSDAMVCTACGGTQTSMFTMWTRVLPVTVPRRARACSQKHSHCTREHSALERHILETITLPWHHALSIWLGSLCER